VVTGCDYPAPALSPQRGILESHSCAVNRLGCEDKISATAPRTYSLGIGAFVWELSHCSVTLSTDYLGRAGRRCATRAVAVCVGLFSGAMEIANGEIRSLAPLPFFPPPQAIVEVYTDDLPKLLDSVFASIDCSSAVM